MYTDFKIINYSLVQSINTLLFTLIVLFFFCFAFFNWRKYTISIRFWSNDWTIINKLFFLTVFTIKLDSRFNKTIPSLMYVGDEKSGDDYEFVKALRMSGGDGAYSYSANSLLQRIFLWVEFRDPRFYPSSCESLPSIATIGDRSLGTSQAELKDGTTRAPIVRFLSCQRATELKPS
ncbi:unnamed protein product [Brassica oleracea var. botrytis]|uniref:(rape) hypothetical protein n=1 Tax=Brassica napus TaxID=3708 RepID=A0A816LIP2_BRANA|nr:unnamed protein product [Brassica napus]